MSYRSVDKVIIIHLMDMLDCMGEYFLERQSLLWLFLRTIISPAHQPLPRAITSHKAAVVVGDPRKGTAIGPGLTVLEQAKASGQESDTILLPTCSWLSYLIGSHTFLDFLSSASPHANITLPVTYPQTSQNVYFLLVPHFINSFPKVIILFLLFQCIYFLT